MFVLVLLMLVLLIERTFYAPSGTELVVLPMFQHSQCKMVDTLIQWEIISTDNVNSNIKQQL